MNNSLLGRVRGSHDLTRCPLLFERENALPTFMGGNKFYSWDFRIDKKKKDVSLRVLREQCMLKKNVWEILLLNNVYW